MSYPQNNDLRTAVNELVNRCHGASLSAGWWTDHKTGVDLKAAVHGNAIVNGIAAVGDVLKGVIVRLGKALVAEKLCLSHSELSEGMEGHRKGKMDDKLPHRPMLEVELADAVIRICDLAGALELDLGGAIAEKMAFNAVRPDHKVEARMAAGGKSY